MTLRGNVLVLDIKQEYCYGFLKFLLLRPAFWAFTKSRFLIKWFITLFYYVYFNLIPFS